MTPAHQAVQGWNAPRLMEWAGRIGPHTKAVIEHVLHQRRHPQQGYRSCLGILRLSKTYGEAVWRPPASGPSTSTRCRTAA
jgi:hypothetical protein